MKTTRLTLVALTALASFNASAACSQNDAKGTWITYQAAFLTTNPHIGQCKLVVDKNGNISASDSNCDFLTFNTGPLSTDGTIKVNKDCSAEINLGLGSTNAKVQINKSKSMFSGIYTAQTSAVSGTTTGVKQ